MANTGQFNLEDYCVRLAESAKKASAELRDLSGETKNSWLRRSAAELRQAVGAIMTANAKDLERAPQFGLTTAQIDRLRLDEKRIEQIAVGLEEIAGLPDPLVRCWIRVAVRTVWMCRVFESRWAWFFSSMNHGQM
mgnify:CR=1 FL=1